MALVGVTLYRAILPLVDRENGAAEARAKVPLGLQPVTIHGARVFVLPNPSGRNANFSYAEMLTAFRGLSHELLPTVTGGLARIGRLHNDTTRTHRARGLCALALALVLCAGAACSRPTPRRPDTR